MTELRSSFHKAMGLPTPSLLETSEASNSSLSGTGSHKWTARKMDISTWMKKTIVNIMKKEPELYGEERVILSALQFYTMAKSLRDQLSRWTHAYRYHVVQRGDASTTVLHPDKFPGENGAFLSSSCEQGGLQVFCRQSNCGEHDLRYCLEHRDRVCMRRQALHVNRWVDGEVRIGQVVRASGVRTQSYRGVCVMWWVRSSQSCFKLTERRQNPHPGKKKWIPSVPGLDNHFGSSRDYKVSVTT